MKTAARLTFTIAKSSLWSNPIRSVLDTSDGTLPRPVTICKFTPISLAPSIVALGQLKIKRKVGKQEARRELILATY
jgi:hypothetical protein